jgi:hypothetical protein
METEEGPGKADAKSADARRRHRRSHGQEIGLQISGLGGRFAGPGPRGLCLLLSRVTAPLEEAGGAMTKSRTGGSCRHEGLDSGDSLFLFGCGRRPR